MTTRLVTAEELLEAPTGFDWQDVADNVGAGSTLEAVEQTRCIERASNWASRYIYNSQDGRLEASSDTETGQMAPGLWKVRVDNKGYMWFRTAFFPILSVTSFQWATAPAGNPNPTFNALDVTKLLIYGEGTRKRNILDISQDWTFLKPSGLVTATYVNGWPNAVLTAAATAGANVVLQVDDSTGFTATPGTVGIGGKAKIYDGANTEDVTVTAVTDATHVTVANLANNHAIGVGVSGLPPELKWGVILACTHFARFRGSDAVTFIGSSGGQKTKRGQEMDALEQAAEALDHFKVRT